MTRGEYIYEYPRPAVSTDCVIFGFDEGVLKILLIERSIEPFWGVWALPGGFISEDEDADLCAKRILQKETNLANVYMEQLYTFTDVVRDPRFRVISIAYYALVNIADFDAHAGIDASSLKWFPVFETPELAFDHRSIVDKAFERLQGKIKYQPIGFELLPRYFTIPDLQRLYEAVLQIEFDRRNFRKKILSYDLLIEQNHLETAVKSRTPKVYCFDDEKYSKLSKQGFYFEL